MVSFFTIQIGALEGDSFRESFSFGWHNALFPTGRSGIYTITIANWLQPEQGPMQVVSGALGKERIHFEAPSADRIPQEMELFLDWFNRDLPIDPVLFNRVVADTVLKSIIFNSI